MLTGSWRTSLAGWLLIGGDAIAVIADIINKQGIPDTILEWTVFGGILITGIGKLFSKDSAVSNATRPVAPVTLTPAMMATPNPSAVPPAGGHTTA